MQAVLDREVEEYAAKLDFGSRCRGREQMIKILLLLLIMGGSAVYRTGDFRAMAEENALSSFTGVGTLNNCIIHQNALAEGVFEEALPRQGWKYSAVCPS